MRQFKGLIITCVLTLLSSMANAQVTVVIDNQTIPTEHLGSISILKNTNVVSISTNVPYTVIPTVVGDEVAITSFTITPGTIEQGENATLNWTTENADACTASGGVASWDGPVAVSDSQQVTSSDVGPHIFTLTCSGSVGNDAIRNVTLTVNLANAVAITSFSANPASILEGETTTLSWVTENANTCTPSLGTTDWQTANIAVPTGSVDITIADRDNYTFRLTCEGDVGEPAVADYVVEVTAAGVCGTPALDGTTTGWQTFWAKSFPEPVYKTVDTNIARAEYKAIRFETGDISSYGRVVMVENTLSPGVILAAITECPGDFEVTSGFCDQIWGLGNELEWSTDGTGRTCQLLPNTTYYLNITFTDGVDPSTTSCGSATACRASVNHRNY